jgi:hypothetical protein
MLLSKSATTILLALLAISASPSEPTLDEYVLEAREQLQEKQDQLISTYKLGAWERFDWDQDRQELVFSQDGKPRVIAKIQFVGSFSKTSSTWRWAWANDSILPAMKADIVRVRQLGAERGWSRLTEAQWPATEQDGWEMTAIAVRVLDAKGAYLSRSETVLTFMVITSIRWASGAESGEGQKP